MRGGEYLVMEVLGEGNMATVYLVRPPNLPLLRYAVKMVRFPEQTSDELREEFLRCFERERQIMEQVAQLHHPNIAALYGTGTSQDGSPYIILEQLEGETLHAHLGRRAPLPFAEALRITAQLGDALTAIHGLDIVHRDLSTRNVFLCRPRTEAAAETQLVKLIDFGVAKFVGATLHPGVYGSPAYMAPEQAAGGDFVDTRADQFGLAAILFEMLSGEPAFAAPAERAERVLLRVQREDLGIRIDALAISRPARAALKQALSKEPDQRFRSVQEFMDALQGPERAAPKEEPSAEPAHRPAAGGPTAALPLPSLRSYILLAIALCAIGAAAYRVSLSVSAPRSAGSQAQAMPDQPRASSDATVPPPPSPGASATSGGTLAAAPAATPPVATPPAATPPAATPAGAVSAAPPAVPIAAVASAPADAAEERSSPAPPRPPPRSGGRSKQTFRIEPHFGRAGISSAARQAATAAVFGCLDKLRGRRRLPGACRLTLSRSRAQDKYYVTDPECQLPNNDFVISLELCASTEVKSLPEHPESFSVWITPQPVEGKAAQ
ncbi:MAG: serine/threonine-protein kinase [Polyangia bacterium]